MRTLDAKFATKMDGDFVVKKWIKNKPFIYKTALWIMDLPLMTKAVIARISLSISPYLHNQIAHWFLDPHGEKIDIRNPQLFNEKIEWLKYFHYNDSPLIAMCYDKLAVREYIKSVGLGHILVPLLGSWNRIKDIDWEIPEKCVYKVTNGWSNHVFHLEGKAANIENDIKILNQSLRRRKRFWLYGDKFACTRKNRYICEKYISEDTMNFPIDYKFYCFNGKPMYVLCCMDRNKGTKFAFLDLDWNLRYDLWVHPMSTPPICPADLNIMVEYASVLSQPFAFVRVDLYQEDKSIYFGELTFAPSTAYSLRSDHGIRGMKELGRILKLNHSQLTQSIKQSHTE